MDWFPYDKGLRHEKVNDFGLVWKTFSELKRGLKTSISMVEYPERKKKWFGVGLGSLKIAIQSKEYWRP